MLPRSLPENLHTGWGWHAGNGDVICKSCPLQQMMDIIRMSFESSIILPRAMLLAAKLLAYATQCVRPAIRALLTRVECVW